jgi:hypothetical protein
MSFDLEKFDAELAELRERHRLEMEETRKELALAAEQLAAANAALAKLERSDLGDQADLTDRVGDATVIWMDAGAELPDEDMTVLVALADGEVWTGFLEGGDWRYVSGDRIEGAVLFWADFPLAPVGPAVLGAPGERGWTVFPLCSGDDLKDTFSDWENITKSVGRMMEKEGLREANFRNYYSRGRHYSGTALCFVKEVGRE